MAELRRVGGSVEPLRRPSGRRSLLPAEAELCNAVGITEAEYWHFVELTEAYNGKRSDAYGHLPDVRNDPVSFIITLVVGLALSAVSALLAPKPQEEKEPRQTKTEDIKGQSKFAPTNGFDAVQELATLGAIIPLVFARKGVRVKTQLIWSQMLSLNGGHQLKAVMLLAQGGLHSKPDFAGCAIGDVLLENYTRSKVELSMDPNGGRLTSADLYSQGTLSRSGVATDTFSIRYKGSAQRFFSGTRTPASQTQFGAFSPMPNGVRYMLNYELVLVGKDMDGDLKDDAKKKKQKNRERFPTRASVAFSNSTYCRYYLDSKTYGSSSWGPWGNADIKAAIDSRKTETDQSCLVGELYLCGTKLAVCESVTTLNPWREGLAKSYYFYWTEGQGTLPVRSRYEVSRPFSVLTIQRAAVATISNNRECNATEIGIKSVVWGQIQGFSNVNSYPGEKVVKEYEDENGSFTLGGLTKYIKRLSFFRLYYREAGKGRDWANLSNSRIFCVKGNTPQAQFNFLRIYHPFGQYEFRLVPVSGAEAYRSYRNSNIYIMQSGKLSSFTSNNVTVEFSGNTQYLDDVLMSNSEWYLGEPPEIKREVIGISSTRKGYIPPAVNWGSFEKFTKDSEVRKRNSFWFFTYKDRSIGYVSDKSDYLYSSLYPGFRFKVGDKANKKDKFFLLRSKEKEPIRPNFVGVVSASGGGGSGLTFNVTTWPTGGATWSIASRGRNYDNGASVYIPRANAYVRVTTDAITVEDDNLNPFDAISDYPTYDVEARSNQEGPEHEVTYVNEILEQAAPVYPGLATVGLRLNSSTEWSSFSDLSAYVKYGTVVERLAAGVRGPSNIFPDIAYALLTNKQWGAGELVGAEQVNRGRMAIASKFCEANGFTWDGVIDQSQNLRQFIFEQAGYCLLDFTILGGQFSLIPSVPFNPNNHKIDFDGRPEIKALFTDGNIRKLQVTFLGPEERQPFKAVCLYRQEKENGFAETRSLAVWLSAEQGGNDGDPVETFDMGAFCTSRDQAEVFAKYALKVRREIDHGLKFETTPQAAMNLAPGEYFKLASEVTHVSRFNNGTIAPDGTIQSTDAFADGKYQILFWEPGTEGVKTGQLVVTNGKAANKNLRGTVFTLKNTTTDSRVYKVESLSYGEDGMVEVSGSFTPLTSSGSLAVLDWGKDDFVVEVN